MGARDKGGSLNAHIAASALSPRLFHGITDDADPHLRVVGTAVVVDISGFTSLSEQLAAAGREGTEQLIATLSRIFTVLLPATDDGGDVVKFAGDALFVLFTGADHARHAVHAAWNMNRVLAAIGDVHLPAARARLRMSVGVHSGTFEFVVTGGENVSVVLTGAATTRVLDLQGAAESGRILVSDATAAQLPAALVAKEESAPGARRLLKGGSVAAAQLSALSVGRTSAAERFLPRAFAQRPDLLSSAPDHRWAAIAFVQVSGVPDEPTADDVARMHELTTLVEDAAAETGATLLDVDPAPGGFRYFLTAGAPTTTEDPEGRLLAAVLRIVHADAPYTRRGGVTSGRVFAGFVGAMYRQTYTVMGDPTNLAARLASRAEPGTILVARSALERAGRPFDAEDAGVITVKGKQTEIPVAVVTGHGGQTELAAQRTPFIGRADEVERLRTMLDAAARGEGSMLTLSGPAGIGKTRLVAHVLAETPLPVLRARGDRYGASTPYGTLRTLLRPVLGIDADTDAAQALRVAVQRVAPQLEPWMPLLAPAVGADVEATPETAQLDDAFRAERTTAVLGELIAALTTGPGCLCIDDAQWIDPASATVLGAVLATDTAHAILLVRRDEPGGLEVPGERLALGPLTDGEVRDVIEAVAGRRLLPADARPLIVRASGNPLYAIELAQGLAAGDDNLAIEQLIGERIDALSETDRTTLRHASVLGSRIPLGLYMSCVGIPLITGGLGAFLEQGIDAISFRSELFRDVAYDQLPFQTRRERHRAAAAALEANPALGGDAQAVMLAVHYEAAGDWAAAREAATRAAEAAVHAFALEEAVRAYRMAVAAARQTQTAPDDLADLLEALGEVSVSGGWAKEGLEAFSAARALLVDAVRKARLDRERAYALTILGRHDDAAKALRSARRALTGAGPRGRAVTAAIAVTEAGLRLRQSRWAEARTLAAEAIAVLDAGTADADETRVLADALRYHDIAASELEGDAGMQHLPRALALYDSIDDELSKSKVLSLLGVRAYYRGDWTTAAGLYGQARAAAEAAGDVVGAAIEAANSAEILIDQGRLAEAAPLIADALRVFEASDNPYLVAFVTDFAGRAAHRAGDHEAAAEAFRTASEGFAALGEEDAATDARLRLSESQLDAGALDDARATAALTTAEGPRALMLRSRLAAAAGDEDEARVAATAALDAAGSASFDRALCLAHLTHLDHDPAIAREAQRLLQTLGVVDAESLLSTPLTPEQR